jgi:hypothetical protein
MPLQKKALCYAVANGRTPGIFFSWEEAHSEVHKFPNAKFKGFRTIADADVFLKSQGLYAKASGGWIRKNGIPVLYKHSKKRGFQGGLSSVAKTPEASGASRPLHAVLSMDSSPESEAPADDSRKKFRQDVINLDSDSHESSKEEKPKELNLDPIQQQAIDAAMEGKNIFITGVAGTGKSLVTKLIVEHAKALKHEVAVAAPTGVAAVNLNLGAQTVHSLAGVRVPQRARDFSSMHSRANIKKWRKIQMLVVDEVVSYGLLYRNEEDNWS